MLQIKLEKRIGSGGFAKVFSGTLRGQPCAVKCARKENDALENDKMFLRELCVLVQLSGLRHKNLLEFRGKIIIRLVGCSHPAPPRPFDL